MDWLTGFGNDAVQLLNEVGDKVTVYAETFEASTANTSAGSAGPVKLWEGKARIEVYQAKTQPKVEGGVMAEIPDWVGIFPKAAVDKITAQKTEWWVMCGSQRLNPLKRPFVNGLSGGIATIGFKGGSF